MSTPTLSHLHEHQFDLGAHRGDTTVLRRTFDREGGPPLQTYYGLIENLSSDPFTFQVYVGAQATGTITLTALPSDGETVVIDNGGSNITLEFDDDDTATGTPVEIGTSLPVTVANLAAAIDALSGLRARVDVEGVIHIITELPGVTQNTTISGTALGAGGSATGLSGGTGALHNVRINGTDATSQTIAAGARIPFVVETDEDDPYDQIHFAASPGGEGFGRVTFSTYFDDLVLRGISQF